MIFIKLFNVKIYYSEVSMKIFVSVLLFTFILTELLSANYSKHVKTKEEKDIARLVVKFIKYCRKHNYTKAHEFTTGKERKVYDSIIEDIKKRNGAIPAEVKNYFARLQNINVDFVAVDDINGQRKAVVSCIFKFMYYDSSSRDQIRKDRRVLYYLQKEEDGWKIAHSKLDNEKVYYRSKTNNKWRLKY